MIACSILKWTPPGRGLWMMGTKFIEERTAAGLFNCAFDRLAIYPQRAVIFLRG
jgi:hypothetical protein